MKRPEVGTFAYWRSEVGEFWRICENATSEEQLDRAFRAMLHVVVNTTPADAVEEILLQGDLMAVKYRYERACLELLGIQWRPPEERP